jgi:hypothetical protein
LDSANVRAVEILSIGSAGLVLGTWLSPLHNPRLSDSERNNIRSRASALVCLSSASIVRKFSARSRQTRFYLAPKG